MKTEDVRGVGWLYGQLPGLVRDGVVSAEEGERLAAHYGPLPEARSGKLAMAAFAIVGTVLVCLGLILLFAFNWRDLPRAARVVLACLPLCASLGLGAFAVAKRMSSSAWREAVPAAVILSFTGGLALIGQTYQLPGKGDELLLPCFLLALPLVYIFDSSIAQLLYLIGISAWTCLRQAGGGEAAAFWPFLLLILPRVGFKLAKDRHSAESGLSLLMVAACLSVCLGVSLEKVMPGLWIIAYGSLFSCLYLVDGLWLEGPSGSLARPFLSIGRTGLVAMAFILSYGWPWMEIGWDNMRSGERFKASLAWVDYAVVGSFLAAALSLCALAMVKRKSRDLAFALFPLLISGCYLAVSAWEESDAVLIGVHLAMNLFILYAGMRTLLSGLKARRLADANLGAFIIALLIFLRFVFAEDFSDSLVFRGLAFIAVGSGFLAMNFVLARVYRRKG